MLTTLIIVTAAAAAQAVTVWLLRVRQSKINRLMNYFEIGRKITSNIKLKPLMQEIIETVKGQTQADACSLYLIDEEKQELWFEVALGDNRDKVTEIRVKLGEGISGWVAKTGQTLNLRDASKDERFHAIAGKLDFKQKAMLTVPVIYQNKTVGVIQLINKTARPGYFTREDEQFLEGITSQVAIALENAKLYEGMRDLFTDTIASLAGAIDAKDPYTNGHSLRVTQYSLEIGRHMGFDEEHLERLEYMAMLHDVGKIGVADAILNKRERLDEEEFEIMKSHVLSGARIMESAKSLRPFVEGVKYHHEKFDGTGYCEGLHGDGIPLEARIIAVADTFDAMTTTRPYRKGLDFSVAIQEINRCAGTQFDPEIVAHFNAVIQGKLAGAGHG
ncbi:MAG: hamp domain/gaf domain/hd protein [Paenibacillaceae bacterium]|nr:hamp domain/gaf domain/hd protein [Paenibacillaceae bacterium]